MSTGNKIIIVGLIILIFPTLTFAQDDTCGVCDCPVGFVEGTTTTSTTLTEGESKYVPREEYPLPEDEVLNPFKPLGFCGNGICDENETEISCTKDCRLVTFTVRPSKFTVLVFPPSLNKETFTIQNKEKSTSIPIKISCVDFEGGVMCQHVSIVDNNFNISASGSKKVQFEVNVPNIQDSAKFILLVESGTMKISVPYNMYTIGGLFKYFFDFQVIPGLYLWMLLLLALLIFLAIAAYIMITKREVRK